MASNLHVTPSVKGISTNKSYVFPLTVLTTLFFMWGFITVLNDILIPHLKKVFVLNYSESMLIQFCFFGAYFIVSIPASYVVKRIGYKVSVIIGLVVMGLSCALFYPAAQAHSFGFFLGSLFLLSSGITLLQVAANPYIAILGPPEKASTRLNLAQAFNSLGTTLAPLIGSYTILSGLRGEDVSIKSVQTPYLALAALLLIMASVILFIKLPDVDETEENTLDGELHLPRSIWQYPHLVLGAIAIFVYVGAEVAIGSLMVNYLGLPEIKGMPEKVAGEMIAFYWGGAMVGRFIGSAILQYVSANRLLIINACAAIICLLLVITQQGDVAMYSILIIGLFNSIMFPNIFTLSISKLGKLTSRGSGVLCAAIVGGAIIPIFQGKIADIAGLQISFLLPIACYVYIAWFAYKGYIVRPTSINL